MYVWNWNTKIMASCSGSKFWEKIHCVGFSPILYNYCKPSCYLYFPHVHRTFILVVVVFWCKIISTSWLCWRQVRHPTYWVPLMIICFGQLPLFISFIFVECSPVLLSRNWSLPRAFGEPKYWKTKTCLGHTKVADAPGLAGSMQWQR